MTGVQTCALPISGVSIEQFATDLTEYFRNLLFLQHDVKKESILGYSPERFSRKAVRTFQPRQTEKALSLLLELYRNLRYSLNQRFEMELTVSRLADLKNYLTKEELFDRLQTLRRELKAGMVAGAPRPEEAGGGDLPSGDGDDEAGEAIPETAPGGPAAGPGEVPEDRKAALLGSLRKKKLALSSALEKATAWRLEGDVLEIFFDDKFSADFVTQDMNSVSPHAREVFGTDIRISVKIRKENRAVEPAAEPVKPEDDDRVEIAKKVFRGEVLK